jgi:alkylhydroperoxidase family enzyme
VLDNYGTAPITERLGATLGLLKKMTLDPDGLSRDDIRTVVAAGVSKQAIQEAVEVAFLFNIYDRLADTMGWDVPPSGGGYYRAAAKRLLTHGYR